MIRGCAVQKAANGNYFFQTDPTCVRTDKASTGGGPDGMAIFRDFADDGVINGSAG